MAKQKGILQIQGTIGNMTFFKTKGGYMVKEKSEISANKIATDPAFVRTRENNAEFARAGKSAKLLRQALRSVILHASDRYMVARLVQNMMLVIKEDSVSLRGQRNVIDGEASLLQGFEFNTEGKLGATLFAPYTPSFNRATGEMEVFFDSFIAAAMVTAPQGATHFQLILAGTAIDFEGERFTLQQTASVFIPWNNSTVPSFSLTATLPANSLHPVFTVLVIEFVQEINGTKYPLKNGAFNAAGIIAVDTPV